MSDPKRYIPGGVKDSQGMYLPIEKPKPPDPFKLDAILFPKQLKFVEDPRPFKVAVCSRRAGKTVACAVDLLHTAMNNPGTVSLYITLARINAEGLVWPELIALNQKYMLGGVANQNSLKLTLPNKSTIWCSGAKDSTEINRFRGHALKKVYIDECQSFRSHIKELIDDVLIPALMDYDGSLILIGTPGAIPAGYFAEVSGASKRLHSEVEEGNDEFNWVNYHWTFFDNPHIALKSKKTHDQVLKRVLKMRGVGIDDPSIQREFFGKWVMDADALWIKYNPELNNYDDLPEVKSWNYILGIDIGFNDADALAVLGWHERSNKIYLIDELVTPKQDLTDLANQINLFQNKYAISKMVIDAGGLGKKLAEELRRRHHIPVQDADKARKQENVAFLNAALRRGDFMAKQTSMFAQDSFLVEIDRDKSKPDKIKISDKYHSDIIDAVLYAFKESPAFLYQPPADGPKPGTPEWYKAQEDGMFEAEMEALQEQAEFERRINGG